VPAAPALAALAAAMPKVRRPNPLLSGTMSVDVSAFMPAGSVLPFQAAPREASPGSVAPAEAAPPVKRAPAALSGTSMGHVIPKGPALPFAAPPASAAPQAAAPAPAPAAPALSPAAQPPAAPAQAPALTLEQYASLCVDLSVDVAKTGETLQRYGMTMDQARALDAYWKGRVASEPAVREAFDRAYAAYRTWLLAPRAGAQTP
jgi:hypothetical protein